MYKTMVEAEGRNPPLHTDGSSEGFHLFKTFTKVVLKNQHRSKDSAHTETIMRLRTTGTAITSADVY